MPVEAQGPRPRDLPVSEPSELRVAELVLMDERKRQAHLIWVLGQIHGALDELHSELCELHRDYNRVHHEELGYDP